MKILSVLLAGIVGAVILSLATPSFAAEKAAKERTLNGQAMCAMCLLKETSKCQTVIQVEAKNGKKINYYLADNDVAKNFHENVCKEAKKVTVTGTVKKLADGKMELTASKIEVVKS
jgi:hypothetical protein